MTLCVIDSMKLQPFSLIDNNQVEQIALTHSDNLLGMMKNGGNPFNIKHINKSTKRSREGGMLQAINGSDAEANLLFTHHYEPYKQELSKRTFVELNGSGCGLLNRPWEFFLQIRYASAQLLAGSVIMNAKREMIIVNTVEVYGRSPSMDAHREQFSNIKGTPTASSLPPVTTMYANTWTTVISSREGKKLIIGTKSMNALITSLLRIDMILPASIGGITINFDMDSNSSNGFIFLDKESVNLANNLLKNHDADMIYNFDPLYQVHQFRSKFYSPSTYLLCRASSVFANDCNNQPWTVFTLCEMSYKSKPSSAKIASRLFRKIVIQAFKTNKPLLTNEFVTSLVNDSPSNNYQKLLADVLEMFGNDGTISILGNHELDDILQSLATVLSPDIATSNDTIAENIKSGMLNGA